METKQFSLQSPEQIAKDYGGNKQKIAQAASMGMVDPTAAVLAGMFIDRMRSAQMQEQQPQGTVAQQVFQPQQAPQGTAPQGAPPPMGAPPMGAPPMGAPPMGAPPMGAPPPPQPPGMAMGGLMDLSVPDDMFEEPVMDAENFAGGGLVAFAAGGEADDEEYGIGDLMRQMFTPTAAEQKASYEALRGAGRVKKEQDRPRAEAKKGRDAPPIGDSSVFMPPGLMAQGSFATPRAFPGQGAAPTATAAPAPEYGTGDMLRQMFTPDAKDQKFAYDSLRAAGRDSKPPAKPEHKGPAKRDAPPMMGDSSAFLPPSLMAQGSFDAPRSFAATPQAMPAAATAAPTSPRAPMAAPTAPRGLGALAAPQGTAPRPAATPGAPTAPGAPPAPQAAASAGPSGVEGYMAQFQQLMGPQAATPYRDRLAAAAEAKLDPKAMAAQKKQDMWQAVAQFGFNMAATNSPYFMQAAGQAGAATVPFMAASSKERKAAEREALKQLADIEGLTAAEKKQALRDGFAYAARRVEQDEEMDYKRDVLDETKRENRAREGLAGRRIEGTAARSAGAPKFPGGMAGAIASAKYQEIMGGMEGTLADPRNRAAYNADPEAWKARYSLRARQTALAYGAQEAKKKGDGGSTLYDQRTGKQAPTAGAPSSNVADMSDAELTAAARAAGLL
jgi:hypothetical protein